MHISELVASGQEKSKEGSGGEENLSSLPVTPLIFRILLMPLFRAYSNANNSFLTVQEKCKKTGNHAFGHTVSSFVC